MLWVHHRGNWVIQKKSESEVEAVVISKFKLESGRCRIYKLNLMDCLVPGVIILIVGGIRTVSDPLPVKIFLYVAPVARLSSGREQTR